MALVLADRVLETSTSEGLGTFALAGAQTGYQTFSDGIGNGNTCYYTINGQTTEQWEVGIGTVSAGTLARTTLISSNTGSFINFVAGVKNVFVTQPASKSIYKDASGNAIPLGSASATQLDITAQGDLRLQDTTGGEYVAIQAPATLASSYTLTMPTDDGTAGQALITDGSGVLSWSSAASGDVYGPASATDNAIARYDGTTGKIIQNSVVTIADTTGNMAGVGTLSSGAITSSSLTSGRVPFAGASGLIQDAAALTFDGTILSATRFAGALNGTVGATTPSTGAFTTLSGTGQLTLTNASDYNLYASGAGSNYMAGALGLGSVPIAGVVPLNIGYTLTGGTSVVNVRAIPTILSDVTSTAAIFRTQVYVQAAAFTLGGLIHFDATLGAIGSTAAIANQYGFNAAASLIGATNNYGFYGAIASGTGRFNFYAAGTAANVFAGTTSIGGLVGSESLRVTPVASAVNYLAVQGSTTGNTPQLSVQGSDTNIQFAATSKGNQSLNFFTNAFGQQQFSIAHTASAVDYLQVTGNSAGFPSLTAQGASANIAMLYSCKGNGSHFFQTNNFASTQLLVLHTASAVNYHQLTGSATGSAIVQSAQGSDTNIDIALTPKGTGVLAFGTYTAGIIAQAGYITIKDAGGTTRRLLVG